MDTKVRRRIKEVSRSDSIIVKRKDNSTHFSRASSISSNYLQIFIGISQQISNTYVKIKRSAKSRGDRRGRPLPREVISTHKNAPPRKIFSLNDRKITRIGNNSYFLDVISRTIIVIHINFYFS